MPASRTRDAPAPSLEVTTDAPQPPMLTIISPTPRAFTFSSSHNLNDCDSPYSTPSSSPFELDLRSFTISQSPTSSCTTSPPLMRTLTPDSGSPASVSHKRRKSSSSITLTSSPSDVERRPKKGDEDYIKRPENAFILFRRKCVEEREAAAAAGKKERQADLSKAISQQWKALTPEERKYWGQMAKEKKKEHEKMYPDYIYRPQRVKGTDGKVRNKKRVKKGSEGEDPQPRTVSFVIPPPVNNARLHGRSASAPTPPPSFQTIQLPSLYASNASCPSSPSLLPMISRRAAYSGNPEDVMQNFDYRPSGEHLFPPAEYQQLQIPYSNIDQSMFSPSTTCSSGPSSPSSPSSGPFTPGSSYTHHSTFSPSFTLPTNVDETPYWEWPSDASASASLMNGDFDINSIPPIQLGIPKDHHHLDSQQMEMEFSPVYDYDHSQHGHHWMSENADFSQFSLDLDPSSLLQGLNADGVGEMQMHPLLPSQPEPELGAHPNPTS
ncbi:hypothetical protein E1B28_002043 [Marasmius oreades]|uniref:HMG box domain-containing protein n=1 Tax=Marasmius oreades TaxID=181124 RepID=A0A9P7V4L6_9AGAR|nr:uncharacterized protein E1B28_002043 [Marasmius oreades]KAG7100270.1 hypothetical protein E1B28_002043 [Marasmius oreades]